jgi:hypothetical protein
VIEQVSGSKSLWQGVAVKMTSVILLGIGVFALVIGGVLVGVQCDQVMRSHQALERLRDEVAELESIPVQQRNALEGNRIVWRQSDVEYFEEKILPRDYAMLAGFFAILVAGMACCAVALTIGLRKRHAKSAV